MESVPEGAVRAERSLAKLLENRLVIQREADMIGINGEKLNHSGFDMDSQAHEQVNKCAEMFVNELVGCNWEISRFVHNYLSSYLD